MGERKIRVGIDVGGTHTKAVALDNETHEIIGESVVMTTHDHEMGVAAGVIECFENCLTKNNIDPDDVVFIAHSTTPVSYTHLQSRCIIETGHAMPCMAQEGEAYDEESSGGAVRYGRPDVRHTAPLG